MNTYIIIVLIMIYTINTGFKRNTKEMMICQDYNLTYNNNNLSNNSFNIINNTSKSYKVPQLDQTSLIYKKQNGSNDNIEELLKFLDYIDVPEPSIEELNKCAPVTLDYNSLKEMLEDKLDTNSINNQVVEIHDETSKDFKKSFNKDYLNFELNEIKNEKSMWNTFKTYIKEYIKEHIPDSHSKKYFRRIDMIEQACEAFENPKLNPKEYLSIFDFFEDENILKKLKEMILKFDKCLEFNKENCNDFLKEFDLKIYNSCILLEIRDKLRFRDDNQKNIIFYTEVINLYKYVSDIPELLTLGDLFSIQHWCDIISVIHLIRIFAEEFNDNKFFILCMIAKAFKSFHRNQFDIFMILNFEFICNEFKHNLYYFVWEFNNEKRQGVRRRKNKNLNRMSNDKKYLKVIFLSHLYQTRVLDEYYKIEAKDIKLFKELIYKVKNYEDCIGCVFNEYLEILSNIIIKCFK